MAKKIILSILVILAILIILIVGVFALRYLIDPKYDMTNQYDEEMVQEILDKRKTLTNVYGKFEREMKIGVVGNYIQYTEFFIKDNMAKYVATTENGKKNIIQENKETDDIIWIFETDEAIMKLKYERMGVFTFVHYYDVSNLDEYDTFKYLGETEINGRKTIVVRLTTDDMRFIKKDIIYIDVATGLISRHTIKSILFSLEDTTEIKEGIVTDEDVAFIDYEKEYPNFHYVEEYREK